MKTENNESRAWRAGDLLYQNLEIEEVLSGEGIFNVFRAMHRDWKIPLVVKSLKPAFCGNPAQCQEFGNRSRGWIKLGLHPNIVSCHYIFNLHGAPALVTEFADGETIEDWLVWKRVLSWKRILDVTIQCLEGLGHAHGKGMTHRDVKPSNFFLTAQSEVKIKDFCLVESLDAIPELSRMLGAPQEEGVLSAPSGLWGTAAYMAPEVWENRIDQVGPWTDIYSLGVMLFEMCCQKRPFESTRGPGSLRKMHMEELPPDPATITPDIPSPLCDFILKCLQKSPQYRFQDCREAQIELGRIFEKVTQSKYKRSKPDGEMLLEDGLNNKGVALLDMNEEHGARECWEMILERNPLHLEANHNLGLHLWRSGAISDVNLINRLNEIAAATPGSWYRDYLHGLVFLEMNDYDRAVEILMNIIIEDSGRKEMGDALNLAKELRLKSKKLLQTFHPVPVVRFDSSCLGRDGSRLLTGSKVVNSGAHVITLWDTGAGNSLKTMKAHEDTITCIVFDRDEKRALSGSGDGLLKLWSLDSAECLKTYKGHAGAVLCAHIFEDGSLAASGGSDGTIRLWDVDGENCTCVLEGHEGAVSGVQITGGGRSLVSSGIDGTLRLWDIPGAKCLQTFQGHTQAVTCFSLDPDERFALSGSADGTMRLWNIDTGLGMKMLSAHTDGVSSVRLGAGGMTALSCGADRAARMWDLGAGRCLHSYRTHTGRIQGVEIIEDRLFAISLSSEDTCELWELSGEIHPVLAPYVLCRARNELFLDTACTGSHRDLLEKAKEALSTGDVQLSAESIRLARQDPQCQKDEELLDLWSSLYLKLPRMDLGGIYEGPVLKGHSAPVTALCVSEDCRLALSGSSDKTLRLWDVESGRTIQLFEGHTDEITSAGIDGSNIYALSGSADGTARLWDIPSGICLKTLEGHTDEVTSVTLTRDGRLAVTASGGSDGSIRIWETLTGSCVKVLNDKGGAVISTSLSLDERFLLAGNIDRSLLLWDIAAGKVLKSFQGSKKTILKVLMSEDARFAFSCEGGSSENTPDQIIQWDVGQERSHRAYSGHQGGVSAICLTGDGKFLFSGDGEGKIIAWDTTNGRRLKVLEAHAGRVHSLALFKDSRYLLSAGEDNLVKYWMIDWKLGDRGTAPWTDDARPFLDAFLTLHVPRGDFLPLDEDTPPGTAEGILTRKGEPVWTLEDFEDLLYGLACAGYGWMEPASVRRKLIEILSLRKRRQSPAIPAGVDFPRYQKVKSPPLPSRIDLPLPDRANGQPGDLPGEIPETSREDTAGPSAIPQESPWAKVENLPYFRKAHVSLAMGEEMPLLRGEHHFKAIRTAALSCDGSRAVSGGNDAILKLWNLQDGTFVMDMAGHKDIIYSAAFSPDGTRIISGSGDRTVRIWDALTGECLTCLEGHKRSVFGVAFSKGGRFALSGGEDHILKLWDVDSGRCLNNFAGHTGWVQSVCFSADGQLAVSASQDRNVKIWEIATGECLLTLRGHSGVLRSVNISDTGHIVSGSRDATVRIWELPSGKCIKTLQGHGKSVNSVCFSPDGKYVLSGAGEFFEAGEMKLWDVQEGTCLETLEQKAGVTSVTFSGDGLIAASGNALHEIKVWKLQWELKDHEPALWDEGVRPYLTNFLFTHTPMGKALPTGKEPSREDIKKYLNRSGAPRWSDEDFALLMHQLASRGYGYLKAEGIMKELKNMTGQVSGGMAVQGSHR